MGFLNTKGINSSAMNATQSSGTIESTGLFCTSGQFTVTGVTSATGTMKLQVSNDRSNPTNWSDITSIPLSGNGVYLISKVDICYQYIRYIYIPTVSDAGARISCVTQALAF